MFSWKRPHVFVTLLVALSFSAGSGCKKTEVEDDGEETAPPKSKPKKKSKAHDRSSARPEPGASDAAPSSAPVAAKPRLLELLSIDAATEATLPLPFDGPAKLMYPVGWKAMPAGDLTSAEDDDAVIKTSAMCYLTSRLQRAAEDKAGVELWARSAGGAKAGYRGPETLTLPSGVEGRLWISSESVGLGPGGKGTTIAFRPNAQPTLLLVGIVREGATAEARAKLAGCLGSFRLEK